MPLDFICGTQLDAASQLPSKAKRRPGTITSLVSIFLLAAVTAASAGMRDVSAAPNATADPPSGPTASVVVFSPGTVMLNNPGHSDWTTSPAAPTTVTLNLTAYDSNGNALAPTTANPLHIHVYGAPTGVITPVDTTITSGTAVHFIYNGAFFPNNMEIAAWIKDPSGSSEALGTTLFVQQNRPTCSYGSSQFALDMTSTVPSAIQVQAIVGADNPSSFHTFTIDTGSLGVIVTKSDLVFGSEVHGPGAAGQKFYDSSGYVFTGHYYLAPVSVELASGSFVQSNPILVLAIDGVHCQTGYNKCKAPKHADLHYLGVGFDRNSTGTGDLFDSPSENAFLQLTDTQNGTDINQGYILSTQGITTGITASNAIGFDMVMLSPNTTVPGDWNPEPGCFQFTTLAGSPQFCGNLLLDVGISEMFIDLTFSQRPAGSFSPTNYVPSGLGMNILAGSKTQPAMSYNFTAVQPPVQPSGPAPTFVQWVNDKNVFVNTGRRPLLNYNYLYSGQCGEVGFQPLTTR
jgi:hypothetical protein